MLLAITGCDGSGVTEATETRVSEKTQPDIAAIIDEHREALMQPGVTAIGESICDGTPCIRIYLEKADPELQRKLPAELSGVPVIVEVSGEVRARE